MDVSLDQIHNEDCLAGMARLPDGVVDLAFADPPFNIGYDYDRYDDRRMVGLFSLGEQPGREGKKDRQDLEPDVLGPRLGGEPL